MTTQWRDILVAYLHDPPDKALQIPGHEARARSYLQFVLGDNVSEAELKDRSDPLAAVAERLPAPYWKFCRVSSEDDALEIRHPLSGARQTLELRSWSQAKVKAAMQGLVAEPDNTQQRFLLAWRRLPELLSVECGEWFARLPADTRIPDHTIWQHLDTTAALKAAEAGSGANAAFLSFSLGPVQSFIAAARSLRDLRSGSPRNRNGYVRLASQTDSWPWCLGGWTGASRENWLTVAGSLRTRRGGGCPNRYEPACSGPGNRPRRIGTGGGRSRSSTISMSAPPCCRGRRPTTTRRSAA